MEFWLFLGAVFLLLVVAIWRSRRVGTRGVESLTQGLPNDMRDRHTVENTRGHVQGPIGGVGGGFDGGGSSN